MPFEAWVGSDELLLEETALLELTLLDAARLEAGWLDELAGVDELVAVLDGLSPESEPPLPAQAERIKVKPRPNKLVLRCVKGIISAPGYVYYLV